MTVLPKAARPFAGFARHLRRFSFPISGEQTIAFMNGVALLGPRSMEDIRQAALATLGPPHDRIAEEQLTLAREGFRRWQTEQARSEVQRAEAQLQQSQVIARESEIRAPADGVVIHRLAEPGHRDRMEVCHQSLG